MNSRTKRVYSGTNFPQQFTPVPRALVKVGLVLPVGCNLADMDWHSPDPEPAPEQPMSPVVAGFREAVTFGNEGGLR